MRYFLWKTAAAVLRKNHRTEGFWRKSCFLQVLFFFHPSVSCLDHRLAHVMAAILSAVVTTHGSTVSRRAVYAIEAVLSIRTVLIRASTRRTVCAIGAVLIRASVCYITAVCFSCSAKKSPSHGRRHHRHRHTKNKNHSYRYGFFMLFHRHFPFLRYETDAFCYHTLKLGELSIFPGISIFFP